MSRLYSRSVPDDQRATLVTQGGLVVGMLEAYAIHFGCEPEAVLVAIEGLGIEPVTRVRHEHALMYHLALNRQDFITLTKHIEDNR